MLDPENMKLAEFERTEAFVSVYIRIDSEYKTIERQTIDLLTFFGILGGCSELIKTFCGYFVSLYSEKKYYSELLRKVFFYKHRPLIT